MTLLSNLVELLGEEATLKIVEAHGGTRVNVPKRKPKKHPLRELLGETGFALLHQYFGGDEISVPLAKRWRVEIYGRGQMTPKEIARRAGYTERAVYRILNGESRVAGQLVLAFDDGRR